MFGFGFWELVMIGLVALAVTGPKELPKILKKLGMWAGRLRRMATEFRVQSGIDEVLHAEGIGEDLLEIRRLARGELTELRKQIDAPSSPPPAATSLTPNGYAWDATALEREYPAEGVDGKGALPEHANVYGGALPPSIHATDPCWVSGECPGEEGV